MNVFFLLGVIALVALIAWVGTKASEKERSENASKEGISDDGELRLLSLDQLLSDYTEAELEKLADIAISHLKDESLSMREQWADLLRRIYQASDLKSGIYPA